MPYFWHSVHEALCIWDGRLDELAHLREVVHVLGLVVPRVPLVALAAHAELNHKRRSVDFYHSMYGFGGV